MFFGAGPKLIYEDSLVIGGKITEWPDRPAEGDQPAMKAGANTSLEVYVGDAGRDGFGGSTISHKIQGNAVGLALKDHIFPAVCKCGYERTKVTQKSDFNGRSSVKEIDVMKMVTCDYMFPADIVERKAEKAKV